MGGLEEEFRNDLVREVRSKAQQWKKCCLSLYRKH